MTATKFLVAANYFQANATALIDLHWKRTAHGWSGWIDGDGNMVAYADNTQQLRGLAKGTTIYLGFGWRNNPGLQDLQAMAAQNEYKLIGFEDVTQNRETETSRGPIHSISVPVNDRVSWPIELTDRKALAQVIKEGQLTMDEVNRYLVDNGYPAFTQQEVNLR